MPFYTRALTPEDYGILESIGVGMFFVVAVFNCGLDSASARFFYMAKTEEEKGKVLFTVLVFRIITIIPILVLSLFSQKISIGLFGTDTYTWVVFLSIMTIPLQLLYSEQEHIYRFYFEAWKFNFVTIAKLLSTVGLGITLVVVMKMGVWGAQLNAFISAIIFFSFSFLVFNRKRYYYKFSWYWGKKMLYYGFPLIFAGISLWFLSMSDRYILLYFKSPEDVGLYSVGGKITQIMNLLAMAVQMSWGPLIISKYESETSKNKTETRRILSQGWRLFIVISGTITLFLTIFGYEIIKILTPPVYYSAIIVIPFLAMSKILSQSVQMTSSGISFFQKTKHFAWISPLVAIINIVLNIIFIPIFGLVAAAATTLIANLVKLLITYNLSQKYFFVIRKANRVSIYLIIIFLLGCFVTFFDVYQIYHISIFGKIFIFLLGFLLSVIVGVINIKTVFSFYKQFLLKSPLIREK